MTERSGISRLWSRAASSRNSWELHLLPDGFSVTRSSAPTASALPDAQISGYLSQLLDDGYASQSEDSFFVSWDAYYPAKQTPEYADLHRMLALPPETNTRIALRSRGSLTDANFTISVDRWIDSNGRASVPVISGPLLEFGNRRELMTATQWSLVSEVVSAAKNRPVERIDVANRLSWGRIRSLAIAAGAALDDFLYRSVVLSPERLDITWRKSDLIASDLVLEVVPTFDGAPDSWLDAFDRERNVQDRYDITTSEGIIQIMISNSVRSVLEEIKLMPGRRIAGPRAQAFLSNPYALLGESAKNAISETQFETAKEDAGITCDTFLPAVERDLTNYPTRIGLLIETADASGPLDSQTCWLSDADVDRFLLGARKSLEGGYQFIPWDGYDLEIRGETEHHVSEIEAAHQERARPAIIVRYDDIHDLSEYSERIEGIGYEKAYYSPFIVKKKEELGWFPENLQPLIAYDPRDGSNISVIPADEELLTSIEEALVRARATEADQFDLPGLPVPMPVSEAERLVETYRKIKLDSERDGFDLGKTSTPKPAAAKRKSLIVRGNIEQVDFAQTRESALAATPPDPRLPSALRPEMSLMPHQRDGLAWLQHLYNCRRQYEVRGAVLADDMGLGKTLQLLALMASIHEAEPTSLPMLVVAPVALLENWQDEAHKFFRRGSLPILTAYGKGIADLRLSRDAIDSRLRAEDGLDKFLKPNWVGDAKIVLTTYETLRDFEFSFARQKWSIMVCDEAQKIKNPAAMVTRAAKKQNVDFKIACTGTPVENTLADLWCLFDFVQPGLLGALNDFGQRYRKPIEAKTDEERAMVEELRAKIAPQIIRRTKADVAKNLPGKFIDDRCRTLPISSEQRALYSRAIDDFRNRKRQGSNTPFKNHLGLLHYLRLICTDPQRYGQTVFKPESTSAYRAKAPKLDWLLNQLSEIKRRNEKVIIFCEFREIQRLLQHYIRDSVGFKCDIINGDTSASSDSDVSRQKRIKAFQAAPGFGAIILSPLAVGFGVNIQAANHVIHYTRTWNPAKEDQATDRAYRIGQTKDVFVYYPVVSASDFTTFDVNLDALLERKRALAGDMLNGSGDLDLSEFDIHSFVPAGSKEGLDARVTMDAVHRMNPRYFECFLAVLWTKLGYECQLTPASGDNGIDIVARNGEHGILIQAKTSGTEGARLNWDAVKDVVAGAAFYEKRYRSVDFTKACVTNRHFNDGALQNAELNGVVMISQVQLGELLSAHIVMESEVERWAFARKVEST